MSNLFQTPQLRLLNNKEGSSLPKIYDDYNNLSASATSMIAKESQRKASILTKSSSSSKIVPGKRDLGRRRSRSSKPTVYVAKRKLSLPKTTSSLSFASDASPESINNSFGQLPVSSSFKNKTNIIPSKTRRSSAPNTQLVSNSSSFQKNNDISHVTSIVGIALVTTNAVISMLSREFLTNLTEVDEEIYADEGDTSDISVPKESSLHHSQKISIHKSSDILNLELSRHIGIMKMLQQVNHWNWDVFELNDISNGNSLLTLSHYVFLKSNLYVKFKIDREVFFQFMKKVQLGYHIENPYHNSTHATDVLHGVNWLKDRCIATTMPTELELLALYFAAIVHDLE